MIFQGLKRLHFTPQERTVEAYPGTPSLQGMAGFLDIR